MRSDELLILLRAQPFEPFALHLSDGARYEIHHPDQLLLTQRSAHVGITNGGEDRVAQRIVICDLMHVTRTVPLETSSK